MADLVARAVVLSRGTTFLITNGRGDISDGDQGFYSGDHRLLFRYEWRVAGHRPLPLGGRAVEANRAQYFAAVPAYRRSGEGGIVLEREILLQEGGLRDTVRLRNYGAKDVDVPLELRAGADFAHIFSVKRRVLGESSPQLRTGEKPRSDGTDSIVFSAPADLHPLGVSLRFSSTPEAAAADPGKLSFRILAPAGGEGSLVVDCATLPRIAVDVRRPHQGARLLGPQIEARGPLGPMFERAFSRALRDLHALAIRGRSIGLADKDTAAAFAAGIPWYIALFGRDALITSRMTLFATPQYGAGSLQALGKMRGRRVNPQTEEAPGKILHEFRPQLDPTETDAIPDFPYYGAVDATPLFLIALEEQVRCAGANALLHELLDAVHGAVSWLDGDGDPNKDGYLEYLRQGRHGLANQGWKDSWDAVHFRDGTLAEGPIALVEVQGYLYRARLAAANILTLAGDLEAARVQRSRARSLRQQFHRDFWMPEREFYAMGLDGEKRRIDALTSNGAQVLWTGIAPAKAAEHIAKAVLSAPLYSGFGVRTLAEGEGRYNPISYHNGSVWPHDNALIAEGLLRYGYPDAAMHILQSLIAATAVRIDRRLPELFAGFSRDETSEPVAYPSACPVQAWAAAVMPHAVALMLGITVVNGVVRLSPALPPGLDQLSISGLQVLGESVDATLERDRAGRVRARVDAPDGMQVVVRRTR
ncbi:MAG: hypothetical protein M0Z66_11850 [Thermaerobacter sp.]|nr:hypothetical protein [Thermaerobacter sp.]